MFGLFGRKSASERQLFVPTWLTGEGEQGGFARGIEGMRLLDRDSGQMLLRRDGTWEAGVMRAAELQIDGLNVVRERQSAISEPTGGTVIDSQCRDAIASVLAMLRTHGLIA